MTEIDNETATASAGMADDPSPIADTSPGAENANDPRDAEIADLKDRLTRALAETENVRRRLGRERDEGMAYAMTGFARDLLTVADNLARAVQAVPESARGEGAVKGLVEGVEATERELHRVLQRHGVERVTAEGQPLDPNFHQAMIEVETAEHPAGHIVAELQAGYRIKERLLRPALVSVAKSPPAAVTE